MADVKRYFDPAQSKKREKILLKGPKNFVDSVEKMMNDWIYWSHCGRQVLNQIWQSGDGLQVTIQHNINTWNSYVDDNPATKDVDEESNMYAAGLGYAIKGIEMAKGTGKGASPTLNFDPETKIPETFCKGGVCPSPRFNAPKYVLFHELVHSMRQVRGMWTTSSVVLNSKTTTLEEGIAILLCNMFMSEKGDNTIRCDHSSLDTAVADPFTAVKEPNIKKLIDKIKSDHGVMYNYLVSLKFGYFPYNPLYASTL